MIRWVSSLGLACALSACGPSTATTDVPLVDTGPPDIAPDVPTVDVPQPNDVIDAAVDITDVPADVPIDAGGLVLRQGGLSSLGVRPAPTGTVRVVDEGFEQGARLCSAGVCVTGGIVP